MSKTKSEKRIPEISDAEFEVVDVLWSKEKKLSAIEIIDALDTTRDWSPKTIKTMLFRLVKKDVLAFDEDRREYLYYPKFKKEDYVKKEGKSFISKLFKGATSPMIMHFLTNTDLSEQDITDIKKLLADIERQTK